MYLNTEDGGKPGEGGEEQRRETGKGGGRQESRVTKWTSGGTIKEGVLGLACRIDKGLGF